MATYEEVTAAVRITGTITPRCVPPTNRSRHVPPSGEPRRSQRNLVGCPRSAASTSSKFGSCGSPPATHVGSHRCRCSIASARPSLRVSGSSPARRCSSSDSHPHRNAPGSRGGAAFAESSGYGEGLLAFSAITKPETAVRSPASAVTKEVAPPSQTGVVSGCASSVPSFRKHVDDDSDDHKRDPEPLEAFVS
jgi:hypothetical protein